MSWERVEGLRYAHAYYKVVDMIADPPKDLPKGVNYELCNYRHLILNDLWFIVYFVLKIPIANHPFVVAACKDVEEGPKSHTLDLWAREHFKSTVITTAEVIQRILRNPEERVGIFSYSQKAAQSLYGGVKTVFEQSELLKACFPDVLYQNPLKESPKWSENALTVRRRGYYREATIEAWGLVEAMPTGKHFSGRVYDDIVTADLVNTPEMIEKVKSNFDLSANLGTVDGWVRVIGTTYHHEDPLMYIKAKKDVLTGEPIYHTRIKPATIDGTYNGKSVYLPETRMAELRTSPRNFAAQQLLNPTPSELQKLNPELLVEVSAKELPTRLFKFMTVDPAGNGKRGDGRMSDAWAIACIGVEPFRDDVGASNIYILDLVVEPMSEAEALDEIVAMYTRNGQVRRLGVEKTGMSTAEIHVSNALRAKGKNVTLENKGLVLLKPAGRPKEVRIEANFAWPLNNGKVHISTGVPHHYRERLKLEMQKFPYWHDDALDAVSYVYDILKEYRFGVRGREEEQRERPWYEQEFGKEPNWMIV